MQPSHTERVAISQQVNGLDVDKLMSWAPNANGPTMEHLTLLRSAHCWQGAQATATVVIVDSMEQTAGFSTRLTYAVLRTRNNPMQCLSHRHL